MHSFGGDGFARSHLAQAGLNGLDGDKLINLLASFTPKQSGIGVAIHCLFLPFSKLGHD